MAVTVTLENSELNPHKGQHPRLTVTGSMTAAEMKLNERGVWISGLPEPPPPSQPVTIRNLCGRDVRIFVRRLFPPPPPPNGGVTFPTTIDPGTGPFLIANGGEYAFYPTTRVWLGATYLETYMNAWDFFGDHPGGSDGHHTEEIGQFDAA